MKAELVPMNGDPPVPITKDVTVVGRREYCDVQIHFHGLSKRHCVFVKTDGLLVVRDLATTNGTKVNGQRVRWAALLPNDRVTVGGYKLRVYLGPDNAPSPSEGGGTKIPASAARRPPAKGKAPAKPAPARGPRNGLPVAPQAPALGFAQPSPLGTPSVSRKDAQDRNWIPPDVLVEDDEDDMPATPAGAGGFPSDDEDEVFIIDLD